MVQYFPVITGSLTVNGNVLITGSINTTAGITGSFSGTATTAQTASSVANLNQNVQITGSLTTSGTITAQTLNVQQVTSSVVYSSGSNVFGNSLSNTQVMTGSLSVTGSLATFAGNVAIGQTTDPTIPFMVYNNTNARMDLKDNTSNWGTLIDNTTGQYRIRYATGASNILSISGSGNVGINTTNPTAPLHVVRYVGSSGALLVEGNSSTTGNPVITLLNSATNGTGTVGLAGNAGGIYLNSVLYVTGSSVGIGTSSPAYKLDTYASNQYIGRFDTSDSTGGFATWAKSNTAFGYIGSAYHIVTGTQSSTDLAISATSNLIFGSGGSLNERMRIYSDGGVSFTTGPTYYSSNGGGIGVFEWAGGGAATTHTLDLATAFPQINFTNVSIAVFCELDAINGTSTNSAFFACYARSYSSWNCTNFNQLVNGGPSYSSCTASGTTLSFTTTSGCALKGIVRVVIRG